MGEPLSVIFVPTDSNGGRDLRSAWPAASLTLRGYEASMSRNWPSNLTQGSRIVVHRPVASDIEQWVRAYMRSGMEVWIQEDDDLSCVPIENEWRPTPEILARHDAAVRMASGIIVTSDALAERYGSMASDCRVIRNRLASWICKVEPFERPADDLVRIGWAGTISVHLHDLRWLGASVQEMFEGAVLSTVGDERTPRVLGLSMFEVWPWTDDQREYHAKMARADIGIVPLRPGEFNQAKSWYKALQYMTLGKPVVVTDLPEQRLLVDHGETGFLASTPAEFAGYVQELVHDEGLRAEMGQAARARARDMVIELSDEWDVVAEPSRQAVAA